MDEGGRPELAVALGYDIVLKLKEKSDLDLLEQVAVQEFVFVANRPGVSAPQADL